jgi:catechol 2,3-dioxygenase
VTASTGPQLSHCGIYARDVGALADFYTRVLGLVVSDRGHSKRINAEFAFLTGSPDHHHQLVIVEGRPPEGGSTVNQLSFKVANLDALKAAHRRVREAGIGETRPVSHGNALSFYFADPEGNAIEVYIDTPWYVPQPHGVPFDITLPNAAILEQVERQCRDTPGFMSREAWQAEIAARLERRR